jgi:hypothetical protein
MLAKEKETIMPWKELGVFLGVLVVWFVLNRWVLPRFGVST